MAENYIIIDASGGTGKSIDISQSLEYYSQLRKFGNIVFAGGLDHTCKDKIIEIREKIGNAPFSIDAESKLRDSKDYLNYEIVKKYLALYQYMNLEDKKRDI